MIEHLALFKLKEDADQADLDSFAAALQALAPKLSGLVSMRIERDARLRAGNVDFGIIARFEDSESFLGYSGHPEHVAVVEQYAPKLIATRHSIQYEV